MGTKRKLKTAEEKECRTFNMGLGVVLAVAPSDADAVRAQVREAPLVGEVVQGNGRSVEVSGAP